jgi:TonB-dependent receptor
MKQIYFLLLSFLFTSGATAQNLIRIKVTDDQNLNLPGAVVQMNNTKYTAVSNDNGIATINNIPSGNYTLQITYIGYKTFVKDISVNKNTEELTVKMEAGVQVLSGILVLGDRLKGQAKALNRQKNSGNVTNIISADQLGRFPDGNIGDAIRRVPGITMQNDQGEARNIVVRGMGPEFNSVTLNGERVPSAEGDNRRVQMDLIPTDMVQTVEVNKSLTPEMDADAIGGSVNLITRAPSNGLRISGTLSGGYNSIRDGYIGNTSLVIGNRFAKNKLGFVFSGSYNSNDFGSDNVEALWAKDANGKLYIADHDIRIYDVKRIRRSTALTFDYKINPRHTLFLTGSWNWRDDKESRFRLRHRLRGDESDLIYNSNGDITGYNDGEVLRQTKGGSGKRNENRRLEDQQVRTLAVRGEHLFNKIQVDWGWQYAKALELRPNERYVSMGRRSIQVNQNISDPERPSLTDTRLLTEYTRLNELTEQFQDQFEEDINARLNITIPATLVKGQKGSLKFGGRLRSKVKIRDNNFFEYTPVASFGNIANLPLIDRTNNKFYPGNIYTAGSFVDPAYLGSLNLNNPALFDKDDAPAEYLATNYSARETITAGFVQLNQQFTDKFSMIAGVRLEHTSLNYNGNVVEDEDNLLGQANYKNSYSDFLPSINLRYQANSNLVLKAAYARSIARPRYYDLAPYFNVNPGDQELSTGNTSLEPVRANNFDVIAEQYFKSVGIISIGMFHKTIDRFFYRYRDDNFTTDKFASLFTGVQNPIAQGDNWSFTQPRNGRSANLTGFEVAVQRQLDFLPGFWKGFGVYLNYTFTSSKAEGIYNEDGLLIRENVKLPGAAPHIFNASLSYETKKLVVRLSANYTSSYVDDSGDAGYNEDSFFDRYYDRQFFLDANASYAITPKLRIFGEATNLTNQPLRYYQGVKERTAQIEFYGPRFNAGVKFDLFK